MNHSFLLEVGHWTVAGNWLEGSDLLIVSGEIDVSWQQQNVFELEMQLRFTNIMEYESRPVIYYNYQGFIGTRYRQYSYIYSRSEEEEGKKNIIEKGEGEGWILPDSIIQRYWVLGESSPKKRTGFESFYRLERDTYHLCAGMLLGYYLTSAMEATLTRQS